MRAHHPAKRGLRPAYLAAPLFLACLCASPPSPPLTRSATDLPQTFSDFARPTATRQEPKGATPSPRAPIPTDTGTARSEELIVDTARIIDYRIAEIEALLGQPTEIYPLGIGEAEEVPDGGQTRTYMAGQYTIWVNYDKAGTAKGLQVIDGLLSDAYSLDDWPLILARMNVAYVGFPDVEAPGARRWNNAFGYWIMIAAASTDGDVWTVRIYKIPK